ncbi:hypothetical protein [Hyphomicrobium nitrativorans]|nr:hypothetical protein [Hyphomicrobium nitrativorans]
MRIPLSFAFGLATAVLVPAEAFATSTEAFHGRWEKVGQACQYSNEETEGDYFSIGADLFKYSSGFCPDPVFKLSGDRLSVTAHCTFGESEQSPVAEQFTLDDGELIANGTRLNGSYERCGPASD